MHIVLVNGQDQIAVLRYLSQVLMQMNDLHVYKIWGPTSHRIQLSLVRRNRRKLHPQKASLLATRILQLEEIRELSMYANRMQPRGIN